MYLLDSAPAPAAPRGPGLGVSCMAVSLALFQEAWGLAQTLHKERFADSEAFLFYILEN